MEQTIEFQLCLGVAGLAFIPGDGTEAHRAALTVGAVLREDPSDAAHGGIDSEVDGVVGSVVDGDEGRGGDDRVLEHLHGRSVGVVPGEDCAFACEVGKQVRSSGVVANPHLHEACSAKEGADVGD